MGKQNLEYGKWPTIDKVQLGITLIDLVVRATGLVRLQKKVEGKHNTPIYIEATEKCMEWIKQKKIHAEILKPVIMERKKIKGLIINGYIKDAKTIIGLLQYFLNENGKKLSGEIFFEQKKRIIKALKNSNSQSVLSFREILKKIING